MSVIKNLIEVVKDWVNEPWVLIALLIILGFISHIIFN